jgi:hypothetical protein
MTPPPAAAASCANPAVDGPALLREKCGLCHDPKSPATYIANLDMVSPGGKARLVNAPAKICAGKTLILDGPMGVTGYLFDKLAGKVEGCGDRMPPLGSAFSAAEIKCVKDWIRPTP